MNAVLMEQKVLINVPFILMGIGIILGGIFMLLVCRHKMPEVSQFLPFGIFLEKKNRLRISVKYF